MLWLRSDSRVATLLTQCGVGGWAFLLSRKLRMLRVATVLSAERVGGCAPFEPEASYVVALLRLSFCCSTQCGVGGWGRSS